MAATLTTTDAFFVAYQERSGILMHLGAELEVAGRIERAGLARALASVVERWPALGCTLARGLGGLRWRGASSGLLVEGGDPERWRNTPIDPFREPPFGVLWIERATDDHLLAIRCHHAVADGMLFLAIVGALLGALDGEVPAGPAANGVAHPLGFARLWRDTRLGASIRHARWLTREARADRGARLALRAELPGPVATCARSLAPGPVAARAAAEQVRAPWLVAAAWLRTLHAWNRRRGGDNPVVSLEVPVSLRRGPHAMTATGNHLAVLTLFGDARVPLGELARALWDDYAAAIKRRAHLAIPLLGAPVRLLPWPAFRRVAVTTTSTGFATSHYTWIEQPDARAALREIAVRDQRFYTPVCLRMGAALGVMVWPGELQLSITHRLTGLTAADAAELAELLLEELR